MKCALCGKEIPEEGDFNADYVCDECWLTEKPPKRLYWYIGWSCGKYGFGVVREDWGWRFMLGKIDYCIHNDTTEKGAK